MSYAIQWVRLLWAFFTIFLMGILLGVLCIFSFTGNCIKNIILQLNIIDIFWGIFLSTNVLLQSWIFFYVRLHRRKKHIKHKHPARIIFTHLILLSTIYVIIKFFTMDDVTSAITIILLTIAVGTARLIVATNLLFQEITDIDQQLTKQK